MTEQLKKKIGQMIVAGFPSQKADWQATHLVEEFYVGNFALFKRNIETTEQTCALCAQLNEIAYRKNGVRPLIGVDQEGGMVSRVYEGAAMIPGHMMVAASPEADVRQLGKNIGEILCAMGINSDFSPVLDVNLQPLNPIIGARSYGDDPNRVSLLGTEMMNGMQESGSIPVLKHYPGHGNVESDSHLSVPRNSSAREALKAVEWKPFVDAFAHGAEAVMTCHVCYESVDPVYPATLSKCIMTKILREEQGFDGIVMTDCMEMDAIRAFYGIGEGAVLAVEAGCDMILFSHTFEAVKQAVEALYDAVESGRLSVERIEESYNRIMRMKKRHKLDEPPCTINVARTRALVHSLRYEELNDSIARKGITLLYDNGGIKKLQNAVAPLFIAPESLSVTGAEDKERRPISFAKMMAEHFGGDALVVPMNDIDPAGVEKQIKDECDMVVLGIYNARFHEGQQRLLESLQQREMSLVVVMLGAPYDAPFVKKVAALVAAYEYTSISIKAVQRALEENRFLGQLPVKLEENCVSQGGPGGP